MIEMLDSHQATQTKKKKAGGEETYWAISRARGWVGFQNLTNNANTYVTDFTAVLPDDARPAPEERRFSSYQKP